MSHLRFAVDLSFEIHKDLYQIVQTATRMQQLIFAKIHIRWYLFKNKEVVWEHE